AELRVDLIVPCEQCLDWRDAFFDVAAHVLTGVETWLLMEKTHRNATGRKGFADETGVFARHDLEQRALAGAVQAEHTNLGAEIKREPDVFQNSGVGLVNLPETLHRVDKLRHWQRENSGCRFQIADFGLANLEVCDKRHMNDLTAYNLRS